MDCRAYCTASSYHIKPLFESLKKRLKPTLYRDVIHINLGNEEEVFYFSYGAIVCWGLPKEKEEELLGQIHLFEDHRSEEIETDEFTYVYGDTHQIVEDEITLPDKEVSTKLAISHGIAQSVKLGAFELTIQKTYNQSKHIPENLAKHGRISLTKRQIRKMMGELFLERNSINLQVEVLDTPEFFWDYPELEPLYDMMAKDLDIDTRVEVLNQRLDVVHELFQMLGTELNHQHSTRLELTIVWLIIIEVILSIFCFVRDI